MNIKCEIDDFLDDDAVGATCTRCGNTVRGTSALQCLVLMRQSCPGGALHRYVEDDGVPDPRWQYEPKYGGDPTCIFTADGLDLHQRFKKAYHLALRARRKPTPDDRQGHDPDGEGD